MTSSNWKKFLAVLSVAFVGCSAFLLPSSPTRQKARIMLNGEGNRFFPSLPKLPIPGYASQGRRSTSGSAEDESDAAFEATSIGLIRQARRLLASDFGILDPSLLADNEFVWIGPFVDEPLGKLEYLAAGRFFDLRAAFPDLDYRPHDFRVDETDPYTIRITCRVTGTMRGALRLREGTLPPTGKRMKCPPEAVTITFNQYGKVTKLCTGFCMDRQVGNTKGATGVMAAALVAGQPPSDWDLYPAPAVVQRFFGRPIEPLQETKSVLAPFPETVMIQLAKGILATNMAANDPSLLADNFEFSSPYVGPIRKSEFIDKYALEEFDNVDPSFSHFRVDPYDPVRVWVDVVPKGDGYQGAPQAMSFSFDEDGFCVRITSSFVMDPSIGNGGGLGGAEGYRYATGRGTPDFLTRPWARVIGRVRKQVLAPLTGVGVDDYRTSSQVKQASKSPTSAIGDSVEPKMLESKPTESLSAIMATVPPTPPAAPVVPRPPSVTELDSQKEINRREAEAVEEAAKLKMKGAEEAKLLLAEMEDAEKKAMEARAKLEKLEAQRIAREKQAAEQAAAKAKQLADQQKAAAAAKAREQADAQKAAAVEAAQKEQQQAQFSAIEKAKAFAAEAAEAAAKRAQELEDARIAAANRLKEAEAKAEAKRQAQAEERRKRLEAQRAGADRKTVEADRKRAEAAAQRAAAQEARNKQIVARKAEAEKRTAEIKAAAEAKKAAQSQDAAKKSALAREESEAERKARAERQKAALESLTSAVGRATVSLFGLFGGWNNEDDTSGTSSPSRSIPVAPRPSRSIPVPPRPSRSIPIPRPSRSIPIPRPSRSIPIPKAMKTPPTGVPVIKRWKQTRSGAITGRIIGSRSFTDGELITTSPIAQGKVASGEVVQTGSGSRYFLD